jgi:rhodanese-related sulfurtransferase
MRNLIFFCLLFSACQSNAQNRIDATKTEQMLHDNKDVQLVDLRTPAEVEQIGYIESAIFINYNSPDFAEKIALLDKEKPVIVYCAAGGRSPKAQAKMVEMGFKQVFDYAGGMKDWATKGKKVMEKR